MDEINPAEIVLQLLGLLEAYEHASGKWLGCEWEIDVPSQFSEMTSEELREASEGIEDEELAGKLADAAEYLDICESDAEEAETQAEICWDYLAQGNPTAALEELREAADLECKYGDWPTWGPVRNRLDEILDEFGEDAVAECCGVISDYCEEQGESWSVRAFAQKVVTQ